jgi:hypothetical protein
MAKAIFESNDAPTSGKPISTPVRSFDRVKDLGDSAFNVTGQDGGTKRLVTNSNNKYTVYKRLGSDEGYPRGYNPEQMGQVHSAESNLLKIDSNASPDEYGRLHPEHEKNLIRQSIARSKIDPTQLRRKVDVLSTGGIRDDKGRIDSGTLGQYHRGTIGHVSVRSDRLDSSTLIHELGHHAETDDPDAYHNRLAASSGAQQELSDFLDDNSEHIRRDGTQVIYGGDQAKRKKNQSVQKKYRSIRNKIDDIEHGYQEGYANKYAEDNYVQDPRDAKRGIQERPNAYVTAALVGPYTKAGSRMSAFSTGYHAAGGPTIDVDHFSVQRKLEGLQLAHTPKKIIYTTHRDYKYTGDDLLKATAAAREAKDAEIRAKNGGIS